MSQRAPTAPPMDDPAWCWRATLVLAAGLTLLRLVALFATPLEFYPDEAQYWLWSRELHWGYVSKPPLIAWLIWASTRIGGDAEAWVRLSAPLVHVIPMLALHCTAQRLYGPRAGLLAAALYGLMPAVQVSALFIATDAPLMACLTLALWAYVALWQEADAGRRRLIAAAFGAALGAAFLAKYAAAYLVIGAALHTLTDRQARRAWSDGAWLAALAALALVFGPNLVWLAGHHFVTVAHTTEVNARWTSGQMFNPGKLLEFVLGQLGVMGPIPFAVLIGGAVILALRKALAAEDRLLLWQSLPPVLIVSAQAFISRAHAHWAAAGYLAGAVLVAGWLVRWRARRWTGATLALQGLAAALVLIVVAAPSVLDATGNGRRLARVRGWGDSASIVAAAARTMAATGGITAVAVEDRYVFNELAYYGRGYFTAPGSAPLRMRPPEGRALNEAELTAPLRPDETRRVLIAETDGKPAQPRLPADFARVQALGHWDLPVGGGRLRTVRLYLAEGPLTSERR